MEYFLYAYVVSAILAFCNEVDMLLQQTVVTLTDLVKPFFVSLFPLLNTLLGLIWLADKMDKVVIYRKY